MTQGEIAIPLGGDSDRVVHLAEGDAGLRRDLIRGLRTAGLGSRDIREYADGASVLRHFRSGRSGRGRSGVLLLDAWLPEVPGLDVLAALRSMDRHHSLPIVLMATIPDETLIRRSGALGANSFILKPLGREAIGRAMQIFVAYWRDLEMAAPKNRS